MWTDLFHNPNRFMRYEGQFQYPPRAEHRIQPATLDTFDKGEYLGEPKLNGSSTSVSITEHGAVAKERHNTVFAIPPKFDFKALHRGKGNMCITGEFMNKSKLDGSGQPFRGFCIWDITAFDDKLLIGSTTEERIELLKMLYPPLFGAVSFEGIDYLYKTDVPGIYRVNTFPGNFSEIYNTLSKVDMIEGFVLKRKNGKLEAMSREQNNVGWAVKVRKPTQNYLFKDGGEVSKNKYDKSLGLLVDNYGNEQEAKDSLDWYITAVKKLNTSGGKVYRIVFVKDKSKINTAKLGTHWTLDKEALSRLFGNIDSAKDDGKKPYIITANVKVGSVNIADSLDNFAQIPDEMEVNFNSQPEIDSIKEYHHKFSTGGTVFTKAEIESKFKSREDVKWNFRHPDNWKTYYDIWEELTPAGKKKFVNRNADTIGKYEALDDKAIGKIANTDYRNADRGTLSTGQVVAWLIFTKYAWGRADIKMLNKKDVAEKFKDGGSVRVGTKVGFMRGEHKGEKGYVKEVDTTYKVKVGNEVVDAHDGDFYNDED